ncbi:hypothetical protein Daus18300_012862 [Diaporthe australafricana]|uniref:Uncharacterized protein n=1 Tax=Diaporthe australafricana TaxID=127596 RepID=A0ABR3W191_9PEZI
MSSSSTPGLFGHSTSQSEKPAASAGGLGIASGTPVHEKPNNLQDKDLHWWLTFARTFKSAVKTPLPDDDSDL